MSAAPPVAKAAAPRLPAASGADIVSDEKAALEKFARLRKLVWVQTWVVLALTLGLVVAVQVTQPVYGYYALNPDRQRLQMAGLNIPNMTNRAVLSWAITSITEIMTMGFGDIDTRLPQQRIHFTDKGWKAYTKAFIDEQIGSSFKQNQLVLTTAPSNTPVIIAQFVNADDIYQWNVQMPVIMTYATNNNVTRRMRGVVSLTIVRVPADVSSAGIAIQSWQLYASN